MADKVADLIWVDVETTGLVAEVDKILEIGIVLTDRWGTWIAGDSWLVGDEIEYRGAVQRGKAHEIVGPMHTASGLWTEWDRMMVRPSLYNTAEYVEKMILEMLMNQGVEPRTLPMAGATVHFDRKMLAAQMPMLEAFFHYRDYDLSSFKQAGRWFNPAVAEAYVDVDGGFVSHRGLDDCQVEIAEYQHYIENFFFVTEDAPSTSE